MEMTAENAEQLGNGVLNQILHITFIDNSIGMNERTLDILTGILLVSDLQSVSVLRNSLSDTHIDTIIKLIEQHRTLTSLSLCWNGISKLGAKRLSCALRRLETNSASFILI
jgi:Ran GTPase-activating protein (RanGAP) involved in mRNA processing and transport